MGWGRGRERGGREGGGEKERERERERDESNRQRYANTINDSLPQLHYCVCMYVHVYKHH